ncbi:MAG: lipase family protein [Magnetococcales bacterium]|nr:lipase family protein [Magnetococcales bacterium]
MDNSRLAVAANMASLAYNSTAQLTGFTIKLYADENIQWLVGRDELDVWIVFRGTDEAADWADNLNISKTAAGQGYVHKGFSDALDGVWWSVMDEIYAQETRHLHLVGHSLGGALAALAASRCLFGPMDNNVHLWTFGQPRCGDKTWADWMNERFGQRYVRVFNAGDIVPHLPTVLRFRHAGSEVFFDEDGCVAVPTFLHRASAAIGVIRTQFPSAIVRLGAHSMERYRANILRHLEAR